MAAAGDGVSADAGAGGAAAGGEGAGVGRWGDGVAVAVQEQDVASGEVVAGVLGGAPGREGDQAGDGRVAAGPQGGAAAHGVADQHGGHRAEVRGEFVECGEGVLGGVGTGAVPAAVAVADGAEGDVGARRRPGQRAQEAVHAQQREVERAGPGEVVLLAAVEDEDGGPGRRGTYPPAQCVVGGRARTASDHL